jgi:hypothetical protein
MDWIAAATCFAVLFGGVMFIYAMNLLEDRLEDRRLRHERIKKGG